MKVRFRFEGDTVRFTVVDTGAFVHADVGAHDIRLRSHRGSSLELGAVRSGLLTTMGFILEELAIPPLAHDLSPSSEAVERALGDAARRKGLRDDFLEAAVFDVARTPLLWSAPFLSARWVWQDALRFRACRVAVANAEDDLIDEDSPATAIAVVEKLGKWRELFACEGTSKRALNAALNDYGETLPAPALWGLRKVRLSRPRDQREPLELLGWLGALPPFAGLARIIEVVEAARDDEVKAALGKIGARTLAQRLADDGDPASNTFLQLLRSATERAAAAGAPDEVAPVQRASGGDFVLPVVALPQVAGLRLIRSSAELSAEGEVMHHCVATLRRQCRRGTAFVFHAEHGGTHATIHVDNTGRVIEARGPCNRFSLAAEWGARVLEAWGAELWAQRFDPTALAWPVHLTSTPPGLRPLRNVRSILAAYDELPAKSPELRAWFAEMTAAALGGAVGLAAGANNEVVHVVDINGAVIATSAGLERVRAYASRSVRGLGRVHGAATADQIAAVAAELPRNAWNVAPPIPVPRLSGLTLIENSATYLNALCRFPGDFGVPVAEIANGAWLFFIYAADRGEVLVRLHVATLAVAVIADLGASDRRAEAAERVERWSHGLWAVRLGVERRTSAAAPRAPPRGTTVLRDVEHCAAVYSMLADQRGDREGKLAAFFARYAELATRGAGYLALLDGEGVVVALARGTGAVLARSDRL